MFAYIVPAVVQVNSKHGTSISFRKHGYATGYKIAKILAGWVAEPTKMPAATDLPAVVEAT